MPPRGESSLPRGDAAQFEKFRKAAEEHQCDPDERRWQERLKKVAKPKADKPSE